MTEPFGLIATISQCEREVRRELRNAQHQLSCLKSILESSRTLDENQVRLAATMAASARNSIDEVVGH